ncbi:MAG: recombination mediator RecR [Phycisphaerales bacterium]|nr:recombination mediator RecR [Phycisphaerales bacterium]
MRGYPEPVERLLAALERLPGIGRRTAGRLAFHLLKAPPEEARELSAAVAAVVETVGCCGTCWHLTDVQPCAICSRHDRQRGCVLVVEQPRDLLGIEGTGLHDGVYHVLMGRIDPLGGVGPSDLTIGALVERVTDPSCNAGGVAVAEVILGLSPTLEGDATALHLAEVLRPTGVRVTRLARGLSAGSSLEHATAAVLADALHGRASVAE